MSRTHETLTALFDDCANAIREKDGTSADIIADTFPARIRAIPSGGITPTGTKQITQAGETDVTEYAKANVPAASLSLNAPSVNSSGLITASAALSQAGWLASEPSSKTLQLTTQSGNTVMPTTTEQTAVASGRYTTGAVKVAGDTNLAAGNIKKGVSIFGVAGSYEGSSAMNIQVYHGLKSIAKSSLTATGVSVTVSKTGTYKISWMAARGSSSGTMSTRLYVNGQAKDTDRTTWTNTYGQAITINSFSLTAGQKVEIYARSGSSTRQVMVGNLIIEQIA